MRDQIHVDGRRKDVKVTCMKTLPQMDSSDEIDVQIKENIKVSEERIREALAERAHSVTLAQFDKKLTAISDGR